MPLPAPRPPAPPAHPYVPLAPVLSRASFGRGRASLPSVLDAGAAQLVTSGRVALALALRELGVGPGDTVLLPAYHSLSMVPPVLWRGAAPAFYRVGMDAAVDLDDIAARMAPGVKALVVTHYFGFPQDLVRIRSFCDAHGLALVEDCAHCFFGEHAGRPIGSFGDYAIASSMKFFPAYDGGVLVSARHRLATGLRPAGAGFELKSLLNTLERGFAYGRLPLLHTLLAAPLAAKRFLWSALKGTGCERAGTAPPPLSPASSESGVEFDPVWVDKRASWIARRLLRHANGERIVARRRANYVLLERALGGLPGCRPLFAQLPAGACPWLFPLLLDRPEPAFTRLVTWGVPVTRFASTLWPGVEDMAGNPCANSATLSRRVLAFPVHQELRDEELAWLCERARAALTP